LETRKFGLHEYSVMIVRYTSRYLGLYYYYTIYKYDQMKRKTQIWIEKKTKILARRVRLRFIVVHDETQPKLNLGPSLRGNAEGRANESGPAGLTRADLDGRPSKKRCRMRTAVRHPLEGDGTAGWAFASGTRLRHSASVF
jgi:hypothetical protein